MKKKTYLPFGIVILVIISLTILFSQDLIYFPNPNLEFGYDSCDNSIDPWNESNLGIQETKWLDDTTLQVKVYVSINCADSIKQGGYEINNDNLILKYNVDIPLSLRGLVRAKCMCAHEVVYKIENLEKKEYQIEIKRTKTLEELISSLV